MARTLLTLLVLLSAAVAAHAASPRTLVMDRTWDRLPAADAGERERLAAAASALAGRSIELAGVELDSDILATLAETDAGTPLTRAVRERIGRPVDVADLLYWLDDLAAADAAGLAEGTVHMPSGRARSAGILLHPEDVFTDRPRRYGGGRLLLDAPPRPDDLEPAADGAPLGPRWTARYRNPQEEAQMLEALAAAGGADFARRIRILLEQFRAQGADAWVFSTVRSRERGYLMYGAFILSRASDRAAVERRAAKLDRLNRKWGLEVPIRWRHPDGWRATIDAAEAMAETYNVVYATQRGARYSSHYGARAADFAAMALPREITLTSPDGRASRTFDLSAPDHPRDLNLAPEMIEWVEKHFEMNKLRSDYPHWSDTASD